MNKIFSAANYVNWLKTQAAAKRPYWYGTTFVPCTTGLLTSKTKQYPAHYTSSRMSRYKADIAAGQICGDCVGGAIKGAAWSDLGAHTTKYASNGVPDTSADGMFSFCKKQGAAWGAISTLPERPGIALRSAGHVGVYIGGGLAVEWRGFAYGCVTTKVSARSWTHWYELPWVDYGAAADAGTAEAPTTALLGARLLKQGCKGEDVRQLQEALMSLGYELPRYGADGGFGSETETALKQMQKAAAIEVDGKYGDESHAALMATLAEIDEDEDDAPATMGKIRVTGGAVNIRAGAGTQNKILTVVRRGTELAFTAQAANGWFAVQLGDGVGWISNKYAEVIEA